MNKNEAKRKLHEEVQQDCIDDNRVEQHMEDRDEVIQNNSGMISVINGGAV